MYFQELSALNEQHLASVLIVDDDPITAELVTQGLNHIGKTFHAQSGEEAIAFCKKRTPDLILMDVNMPHMTGTDTLTQLHTDESNKEIPVIFLTSDTSIETENLCWELGAVDFVTKPFSLLTLHHRVNAHLMYKRMFNILRKQATTDGLTGVQNRRYLDDYLEKQCKLCSRAGLPVSVLLLDIDFFKAYNDTFGHQMGDECLKTIGNTLTRLVARESDCIARYGGEEFAVVMPNTPDVAAIKMAQHIHSEVAKLNLLNPATETQTLTVSIGGATMVDEDIVPQQLIRKADLNLYAAKMNGRNQSRF